MRSFQDSRMSLIANIASAVAAVSAVSSNQLIFEWIIIPAARCFRIVCYIKKETLRLEKKV
jgi:hypothetical protein